MRPRPAPLGALGAAGQGEGAQRRSQGEEQWQWLAVFGFVALCPVAGQQLLGVPRQLPEVQVHEHEGEVVEHVDAVQSVAELDAVEQRRPAFEQADVGQAQVAVAAPDPAVAAPLFEAVGLAVERLQAGAVQGLYRRAGQQVRMAEQFPVVLLDGQADAFDTAVVGQALGAVVKAGDFGTELFGQVHRQRAGTGHAVEQGLLGKAAHHHHPVQYAAGTIEGQSAIGLAGNGAHPQVEGWRGEAVQGQFRAAGTGAARQAAEVQRGVGHRAL